MGRISVDGPGQNNPDRTRAPGVEPAESARTECHKCIVPDTEQGITMEAEGTKAMANQCTGKAASEIPALKPYRENRRTEFLGGRWKRRHHSKPGPRHRPTDNLDACASRQTSSSLRPRGLASNGSRSSGMHRLEPPVRRLIASIISPYGGRSRPPGRCCRFSPSIRPVEAGPPLEPTRSDEAGNAAACST